jgi:hypothetical protein
MRGKRYVEELGRPHALLAVGSSKVRYTATEARKGKPGHRVRRGNLSVGLESRAGRRRVTLKGKARRMCVGSLILRFVPAKKQGVIRLADRLGSQ